MSFKLGDDWSCSECGADLCEEECRQTKGMLLSGHSQVEMKCEDCGQVLTADTTDCEAGEVDINPEWVYG